MSFPVLLKVASRLRLRGHELPVPVDRGRGDRELFPSPGAELPKAEFYVADPRRKCFFELFESIGADGAPEVSHEGNIVLIRGEEDITLLRCRGGAGDIWESFSLPVEKVAYMGFRTRIGRR